MQCDADIRKGKGIAVTVLVEGGWVTRKDGARESDNECGGSEGRLEGFGDHQNVVVVVISGAQKSIIHLDVAQHLSGIHDQHIWRDFISQRPLTARIK